ncbi:hypothetical protein ACQKPX_15920 [Photobacterium sp. DNB23_23_1]
MAVRRQPFPCSHYSELKDEGGNELLQCRLFCFIQPRINPYFSLTIKYQAIGNLSILAENRVMVGLRRFEMIRALEN